MSQHAARRPKKHPLLRLFALLVLLGALAAGALALLFWREITGRDAAGQTAAVTVEQGSGVGAIAAELKEAGVIRFPRLFRWYVGRQGAAGQLQYGSFELEKGAAYDDLIAALSVYAAAESVRLTFPEGTTAIAIARKMEAAGLYTNAAVAGKRALAILTISDHVFSGEEVPYEARVAFTKMMEVALDTAIAFPAE